MLKLAMKFIIFANARSGSTSLAKTLASSPDVNLSMETFHPKYFEWNPDERDYSKTIKSEEDMREAIKEIFRKYNAMKVLKYQFSKRIYSTMLLEDGIKIINLSRRNAFDAALSSLIAQQTKVWQKEDEGEELSLKEIPTNKIREIVENYDKDNEYYRNLLDQNKTNEHIDLVYEDIFSENNNNNIKLINEIGNFLGIRTPNEDVIAKYMVPSSASIYSKRKYKDIPNWIEIQKEFTEYIEE
jgi:LPS sulfotransferase NodH